MHLASYKDVMFGASVILGVYILRYELYSSRLHKI